MIKFLSGRHGKQGNSEQNKHLVAERNENIRGEIKSNIMNSIEKILGVSDFWKSTHQYMIIH